MRLDLGLASLCQSGTPAAAAQVVERGVDRNAIQPSEHVGTAIEIRQATPRANEGLLHHVIGIAMVAE